LWWASSFSSLVVTVHTFNASEKNREAENSLFLGRFWAQKFKIHQENKEFLNMKLFYYQEHYLSQTHVKITVFEE